jgi:hypothetical protein
MMWLYDIPTWMLGCGIVGLTVALCLGGFVLIHKTIRGERTDEVSNVAISFISIICAFHSLLIAFSAVLVWQDFQDSENAVAAEASTVEDVYRDLSIYGGEPAQAAARTLIRYVRTVVEDEWPAMAAGNTSANANELINRVFREAGSLDPQSPREQIVFSEIFRHLNELMNNRQKRLQDAQSAMPTMFWVVVLIATVLLIAYTGLMPNTRANLAMVAGMAASIGLIFFFIVVLDHPFAGETAVAPDPFVDLLTQFDTKASPAN